MTNAEIDNKLSKKAFQSEIKKVSSEMANTYDRNAQAFADQASQLMTWEFIGKRALDKHLTSFYGRKEIKVLDEGCASGRVIEHLILRGIGPENIDGIEISPLQIEIAKQKMLGANFQVGDLRLQILPKYRYDLVTRHMVDEHLDNEELLSVSKNTFDALKPGGVLLVIFTHPDKMTASAGIKESGWFETTFPWRDSKGQCEKGQNYFRSINSYIEILEKVGFVIDIVEGWKIPDDAQAINLEEYEKYKRYGNIRLVIRAHTPM